jgi:EAL and modified HD-GYP domain-containing signal transduction protein
MSSTAVAAARTRFIARQPIFDRARNVQAYELLFRYNEENVFRGNNLDMASQSVMDTTVLFGANVLSNGHSIYLNCTRKSLLDGYITLFSPETTVIEILENVEPEPEVLEACRDLKKAGYRIALDDFVDNPRFAPLVNLADIIKVDFRLSTPTVWADMARKYAPRGIQLLAEKVETHEEFSKALQLGYKLFQGYFFCKPRMLSTRDISASRATYLRILQVVHTLDLDYFKIEALIKSEPALFYRFFRYLNSAATPVRSEVTSIVQAATLLGEEDIRKWLTLVCAVLANEGQPSELIVLALVRARFCELLASHTGIPESEAFMLGLFSLMEAILEVPIKSVLEQIHLPEQVTAALLGEDNPLSRMEQLVIAFEKADWGICDQRARELQIHEEAVTQAHIAAVEWVQTLHLG